MATVWQTIFPNAFSGMERFLLDWNFTEVCSWGSNCKSALAQVIAWQQIGHYMCQWWPTSVMPHDVTKPQRVKKKNTWWSEWISFPIFVTKLTSICFRRILDWSDSFFVVVMYNKKIIRFVRTFCVIVRFMLTGIYLYYKVHIGGLAQDCSVSPLLTHWRYYSLALSHQCILLWLPQQWSWNLSHVCFK